MAGTQVVIDLADSPSFEDKAVLEFFDSSGHNLLAAEAAANVRHHVALSIVAIDRTDNGFVEIAGPERAPFNEIIARYLKAVNDPREVVSDPEARYGGGRVDEHSLVPLGEAHLGRIGFDEWLRRRSQAAA
jgi:hypothetical protein